MPEDCLKIESALDKYAQTEAEKVLADTIFDLQTMHRFAETEDVKRMAEIEDTKMLEWDGNVPPDMTDDFVFLF